MLCDDGSFQIDLFESIDETIMPLAKASKKLFCRLNLRLLILSLVSVILSSLLYVCFVKITQIRSNTSLEYWTQERSRNVSHYLPQRRHNSQTIFIMRKPKFLQEPDISKLKGDNINIKGIFFIRTIFIYWWSSPAM